MRSRGWGGRFMRYSASEKFEIIELVEQSSLSIRRTLTSIGIPRSTFYDWYSRYQEGGIEALEDGKPRPRRIWNKIPDKIATAIVNLALEEPDLATGFRGGSAPTRSRRTWLACGGRLDHAVHRQRQHQRARHRFCDRGRRHPYLDLTGIRNGVTAPSTLPDGTNSRLVYRSACPFQFDDQWSRDV